MIAPPAVASLGVAPAQNNTKPNIPMITLIGINTVASLLSHVAPSIKASAIKTTPKTVTET